jgi:peptide chain release factor 2
MRNSFRGPIRRRMGLCCAYNCRLSPRAGTEPSWKPNASTPSPIVSPTFPVVASNCGGIFDYDGKAEKLAELNQILEDPKIWDDSERAQALGREKKSLEAVVGTLSGVSSRLGDARDLFELARDEDDEDTLAAVEGDLDASGEAGRRPRIPPHVQQPGRPQQLLHRHPGRRRRHRSLRLGQMLLRQYLKYCERKGWKTELLEQTDGDVAGIRSASIKVEGDYAYGFLRTETGVHRLVRKSPFDSSGGRHTSFASLYVYPEIDDSIEVEINPADLRTDTFRASGAGGQHINKTDSAIRITHVPTGIVVQCQNDRSQHRNRAEAMAMLKSRLYELELRKRQAEADKLEAGKTDVGWGHQIRSYVLDNSRIKDLRTNVEISATQKVLDGDLDAFIEASLKQGV